MKAGCFVQLKIPGFFSLTTLRAISRYTGVKSDLPKSNYASLG